MVQSWIERLLLSLVLLVACSAVVAMDVGGLLGATTSQLGVTSEQASGGMGALLGAAKSNMGGDKYGELLSMAPGFKGLAGTGGESSGGLMGSAASMLGSDSSLGQAAQLADTFDSLGLSSDMIGEFAKVALDYAQSEGGAKAMELLKSGLSFL